MTTGRERDIEQICLSALERPAVERAAFLTAACGSDEDLRREVESLLAREEAASSFLEVRRGDAEAPTLVAAHPVLSDGTQLGPYTIVSRLGVGGMGEVYRAHDSTLGREVAIKVLPEIFTNDPERLGRFEREARVLASLNHPNIATIHGVEHARWYPRARPRIRRRGDAGRAIALDGGATPIGRRPASGRRPVDRATDRRGPGGGS